MTETEIAHVSDCAGVFRTRALILDPVVPGPASAVNDVLMSVEAGNPDS
jgi:hypothetical protein